MAANMESAGYSTESMGKCIMDYGGTASLFGALRGTTKVMCILDTSRMESRTVMWASCSTRTVKATTANGSRESRTDLD